MGPEPAKMKENEGSCQAGVWIFGTQLAYKPYARSIFSDKSPDGDLAWRLIIAFIDSSLPAKPWLATNCYG
jgi:hypothetical protein